MQLQDLARNPFCNSSPQPGVYWGMELRQRRGAATPTHSGEDEDGNAFPEVGHEKHGIVLVNKNQQKASWSLKLVV